MSIQADATLNAADSRISGGIKHRNTHQSQLGKFLTLSLEVVLGISVLVRRLRVGNHIRRFHNSARMFLETVGERAWNLGIVREIVTAS